MMNKWKIAFWLCLISSIFLITFLAYSIIDQSVTITYLGESYSDVESDLKYLKRVINETDLTKRQINKALADHSHYEFMDFNKDTISLNRVSFIFRGDKLSEILEQ